MANVHHSLSTALQRLGRTQEAHEEYEQAVQEYNQQLIDTPDDVNALANFGDLLAGNGEFEEAAIYFQRTHT